ncbi:MAG: hypothetical protein AAF846_11135 [Chloroflexota bacterium]
MMKFQMNNALITSAYHSNKNDNCYLDVLVIHPNGQGTSNFAITGHSLGEVPLGEKVNISGVIKGSVYGYGSEKRQTLDAVELQIKPAS